MKPLPCFLLLAPFLHAGSEPDAFASVSTSNQSAIPSWLTPSLDLRTRYEFRDQEGLDPSHAFTVRARVGLLLGDFHGFSTFAELEATGAVVNDYNAGAGASPKDDSNTTISDPENSELNRAWVQYHQDDLTLKLGRQRIIRNNAAFIGNVGWRQNEQTFDAATLSYHSDCYHFDYSYSDRAQRIFGRDASSFGEEMEGAFHFIDLSTQVYDSTLGTYAYLLDVDNNGGAASKVGESNTFGAFYDTGALRLEGAWQDGSSDLVSGGDYDALYAHLTYKHKLGNTTLTGGVEYLEEYFKTPFATGHAFNGIADVMVGPRLGTTDLGGRYEGLTDLYLATATPGLPADITLKTGLHYFGDDSLGETYGYELDVILSKKINEHLSTVVTASRFLEDDGPGGFGDVTQTTIGLTAKW